MPSLGLSGRCLEEEDEERKTEERREGRTYIAPREGEVRVTEGEDNDLKGHWSEALTVTSTVTQGIVSNISSCHIK